MLTHTYKKVFFAQVLTLKERESYNVHKFKMRATILDMFIEEKKGAKNLSPSASYMLCHQYFIKILDVKISKFCKLLDSF
jgi:hypothetical protein